MIVLKRFGCGFSIFALTLLGLRINPLLAGYNGNLEVKFNGLNSSKGQVCVNLFNGQQGFPDGGKGSSLKIARCTPIVKGTARMTFTNLPYGNYAIAAIHDTNGDTRLNSNFLGIPTEGVGFSNNPRVQSAAPSYEETQFFVSGPVTEMSIKMQYFN
jgi:uncharacterized protein (DUF2141 family)